MFQTSANVPTTHSKTKKGVKRKADTTTPVITTVAGKIPTASSPGHDVFHNDGDSSVGLDDVDQTETLTRLPGRLQSVGRRESSGRMIRPPRSRDFDSGENVSYYHDFRSFVLNFARVFFPVFCGRCL